MAITNGYVTLEEFKLYLGISDTTDDPRLELIVESVCRNIDAYCNRRFYTTTADETRVYTPQYSNELISEDDIVSVTTLKTDEDGDGTFEITWSTSDYRLLPYNASLDGRPYTSIRTKPFGSYSFPYGVEASVQIVGKFGWSTVPSVVKQATLLQGNRVWKRQAAPFGLAGSPEFGQLTAINKLDPDVEMLLKNGGVFKWL